MTAVTDLKQELALATAQLELSRHSVAIFTNRHETSAVDLIVEVGDQLMKVQVFNLEQKNGQYVFSVAAQARHNKCEYNAKAIDVFALYCAADQKVAWVLNKDFLKPDGTTTLKLQSTKVQPPAAVSKNTVPLSTYGNVKTLLNAFTAWKTPVDLEQGPPSVTKPKRPKA